MTQADWQLERMFLATAEAVAPLRRSLRRLARDLGASSATQARIALGFSEACVVLLGPAGRATGDPAVLAVQAHGQGDAVVVRVLSRSLALHPILDSDGYRLAVPLIALAADAFLIEHRRGGAGTAIAMRFELPELGARGPVGEATSAR